MRARTARVATAEAAEPLPPVGLDLVWLPAAAATSRASRRWSWRSTSGRGSTRCRISSWQRSRLHPRSRRTGSCRCASTARDRRSILKAKTRFRNAPAGPEEPAHEMLMAPDGGQVLIRSIGHRVATLPHRRRTAAHGRLRQSRRRPDPDRAWRHASAANSRPGRLMAAPCTTPSDGRSSAMTCRLRGRRGEGIGHAPAETRVDITITVPRDVPEGTVVLRGARILTLEPIRRQGHRHHRRHARAPTSWPAERARRGSRRPSSRSPSSRKATSSSPTIGSRPSVRAAVSPCRPGRA